MLLLLLGYVFFGCVDIIGFEVSIFEFFMFVYIISVLDCVILIVSVDINVIDFVFL